MAFNNTDLRLQVAPLPEDFEGTPQDLFTALVERAKIVSPSGSASFVTGDVMPSSNVGPWLNGGTKWYVFDVDTGTYVPLDISDSAALPFFTGPTDPGTPEADDPLVWLKTSENRAVGWYAWNGTVWRAFNTPPTGTTAERPGVPADYEQYFDTDIKCLIHWERGQWRTVSGTPGDVKQVTGTVLADVLTSNPGWAYYGEDDQTLRGRFLGAAAKDPGASPVASYVTDSGITARYAGEQAGEESHVLTSGEIESHSHLIGIAEALGTSNTARFHRVDDATATAGNIPTPVPPNHLKVTGITTKTETGTTGNGSDGTMLITSRQLTLANSPSFTSAAAGHNNVPQTVFLWTLVKE